MSVHDVERHLDGSELEAVFLRYFQHVQVDLRVFVSGEAYVADFASLLRFDQRCVGALPIENPMRIFESDNLMVLDQINAVGLQPAERFFQLAGSFFSGASVNFGHQEYLAAVILAQCPAHPEFAKTVVVIPRVVHKGNAAVNRATNDSQAQLLLHVFQPEMPPSQSDSRHFLPGAAESSINHFGMPWHLSDCQTA